jgi:uroporphyrinogen-III synthase
MLSTSAPDSIPIVVASVLVVWSRENRPVANGPLQGMTIGVTAERRATEQAGLLEKRGARVLLGPTSRVFSYEEDEVLKARTADVVGRPPDFLLASTGFGMRTWFGAAEAWGMREALLGALGQARVANRGAKAASVNTAAGLTEWWRAPRERLDELIDRVSSEPLDGRRVVLQLHGVADLDAVSRLAAAGAEVIQIDAYRLSLPTDPAPAHNLVRAVCADQLAAVTFVMAPAIHNLFLLARQIGLASELRDALNHNVVTACVGPVCAEGAIYEGVLHPLVPARARLVPMIHALTDHLVEARSV